MTLALLVYFAGVLSGLGKFFAIISFVCLGITLGAGFWYFLEFEPIVKGIKSYAIAGAISALICTFIPSERTMYAMAGAYAAQQVAENPDVQRLSGKVIRVIDQQLDSIITEGVSKGISKTKEEGK